MQPAGNNIVTTQALWREAGEWWASEPQREFHRFIDSHGVRRETERLLPSLGAFNKKDISEPYEEDLTEEVCVRIRKARDEKVARACGLLPHSRLPAHGSIPKPSKLAALHILSGYSFGRSCLIAAEAPYHAANAGYGAALIADLFSITGAYEFWKSAKDIGLHPLIGASLEMEDGGIIVLVARSKLGYRSLSQLITECHLGEPRLFPLCNFERLEKFSEGLLCLTGGDAGPLNRLVTRKQATHARSCLQRLISIFGRDHVFVQIERSYLPWEMQVNSMLLAMAQEEKVIAVAGSPVTHLRPEHFPAQDALVCIESLCEINQIIGRKPQRHEAQPQTTPCPIRALNAERYLRTAQALHRRFSDMPELVHNTWRIAEQCEPNVFPARTALPKLCEDEARALREVTYAGAEQKHKRITKPLRERLQIELDRITKNGFAGHFLIAWDMCEWARGQKILLSGRGSVVDSAVAYCLGLSRVDAFKHNLHFDRFMPEDACKRPDIDIDFEARRRDDVRKYLVQKYGDEHVATVGAVGSFFSRGIVREVGKVLGIPQQSIGYLAKRLHGSITPEKLEQAISAKPELRDSVIPMERFRWVFHLADLLMDVPRNMRSHSSGVVISRNPIKETVPCMHSAVDGVKIIQWDKRAAKHFFDKFDVLCLRGNDVLSDAERRIQIQSEDFNVEQISLEDPEPYRAMRAGQLIGVPQSASPAMRQAHIRLGTEDLADARIVQAAIRPGVGGAVKLNELIARRRGKPFTFTHPELEKILKHTYGIVVFQEQIDMLLQTFGKYSSDQAEEIREGIYKQRRESYVERIREEVIERIISNGYSPEIAREVYDLVAVFQGYGFAEGHALAFADISVRSVWCQQNYPAEYFAALLDAQPAGYYAPCTLVNEARTRGVKILPPDVNLSSLKFNVEDVRSEQDPKIFFPNAGIRISLTQVRELSKKTAERITTERHKQLFGSFFDFVARVSPNRKELENLILCGALDGLHSNRRALLWAIPAAVEHAAVCSDGSGFKMHCAEPKLDDTVLDFNFAEKAILERKMLELDIEQHLMAFERERVKLKGVLTAAEAGRLPNKSTAYVVGNPIRLRFPPTSSGKRVMFFDLEDETGLLNVTCFDDVYQRDGHTVVCSPYVTVYGEAQERDGHIAFLAYRVYPYRPQIGKDAPVQEHAAIKTGDFLVG